jgi:hypothetical protein
MPHNLLRQGDRAVTGTVCLNSMLQFVHMMMDDTNQHSSSSRRQSLDSKAYVTPEKAAADCPAS